jgi:hypothetical protein
MLIMKDTEFTFNIGEYKVEYKYIIDDPLESIETEIEKTIFQMIQEHLMHEITNTMYNGTATGTLNNTVSSEDLTREILETYYALSPMHRRNSWYRPPFDFYSPYPSRINKENSINMESIT